MTEFPQIAKLLLSALIRWVPPSSGKPGRGYAKKPEQAGASAFSI
jgi:hypothetical protein